MEIPVTAGPELVLGVVLGILLAALAAVAVGGLRRRRAPGISDPPPSPEPVVDDLPGFLESPPGSTPSPGGPPPGWPALSAPPAPPPPEPLPATDGGTRGALVALAVTALLLVGTAAAVAAVRAEDRPSREPTRTTEPADVTAELTFGGIVLERHAVGVTVTYPRVRVTVRDGRPAAELELPTFNCLRDSAPEDPLAAGCSRAVPEYAELAAPELALRPDGDGFRVSGSFPSVRRPNGSAPVTTGRVYDLAVDVAPRDGTGNDGSEPATGRLELGGERVGTSADGPNRITYGG